MNRISFVLFTAGLVLVSSFSSAVAADRFDKVPAVKGQRANGLVDPHRAVRGEHQRRHHRRRQEPVG